MSFVNKRSGINDCNEWKVDKSRIRTNANELPIIRITSDPVIRKCTASFFIAQSVRVDYVDGDNPHA
jgi:hypothetical protein